MEFNSLHVIQDIFNLYILHIWRRIAWNDNSKNWSQYNQQHNLQQTRVEQKKTYHFQ